MKDKIVPVLVVGALLGGLYVMFAGGGNNRPTSRASVIIPSLGPVATEGQQLFRQNCAACHGENAGGTRQGPPLIHKYYRPGHHADGAFYRAAALGVRAHHWRFGNMPPIGTVTQNDVSKIIAFVREVQKANGIF